MPSAAPPQPPMPQAPDPNAAPQPMPPSGQEQMMPDQVPPDVLEHLEGLLAAADADSEREKSHRGASLAGVEQKKREILGRFFQLLQEIGVDPADPQSVAEFTAMLEQQDPDLAILLEKMLATLAPEPIEQPMMPGEAGLSAGLEGEEEVPEDMNNPTPPDAQTEEPRNVPEEIL